MLEMKSLVSFVRVYISSLIANFSNIFNMPKNNEEGKNVGFYEPNYVLQKSKR